MSARDVIARAVEEFDGVSIRYDDWAEHIIQCLVAAGYPPLGPDEIHAPSVERCVAWHDLQASVIEGQCEAITKDGGWPDRSREADARLHRRSAAALRELMKDVG